jgi:hypothetical protein
VGDVAATTNKQLYEDKTRLDDEAQLDDGKNIWTTTTLLDGNVFYILFH